MMQASIFLPLLSVSGFLSSPSTSASAFAFLPLGRRAASTATRTAESQRMGSFPRCGGRNALSMSVQSASVEGLVGDHEAEGERLSASIAAWLDAEWIPQEVHAKMGDCAGLSYVQCREEGETDIMSIMINISERLESRWAEFDDDAFVNAWDVGNYAADYLTRRSGVEACACSAEIVMPENAG